MKTCSSIYLNDLLFSLSKALDYVETEVFGVQDNHGKRIALMCMRICQTLGYSQEEILDMASCAILHDNALSKDSILTENKGATSIESFHEHCVLGEKHASEFPFLSDASNIILHHHEQWNGSGFFGVRGEAIAPRATILHLADELDMLFAKKFTDVVARTRMQAHMQKYVNIRYSPLAVEALLDICDDVFLESLHDNQLDDQLKEHLPNIAKPMALDELLGVCEIFSKVTDIKSSFTASHSKGVAQTTLCLAEHWKLEADHLKRLMIAAHLHDVGKLTIQADILEKPGRLTDDEFIIMKSHVQRTADLLTNIKGFEEMALWAASHHEKLNGIGYPQGLTAVALPFESRLLACADIYQALTEDRPYREGMSHNKAMEILHTMASRGEIDFDIVSSMHFALNVENRILP